MLLTIALPVFNDADALESTIYSLLSQKVKWGDQVEIIVSDNFSSDNAFDLAKLLLQETPGSKIFRQASNLGFSGNLKFLGNEATGQYLWFLGAGDTLTKDSLPNVLSILSSNSYDWGTVRALFDFQDNSGYKVPAKDLESALSLTHSTTAVFNHAISMNIMRTQIFRDFSICQAHGSFRFAKVEKNLSDASQNSLYLWEDEKCYWPHLEALALYVGSNANKKDFAWFEYHPVTVLLSDNKNGNWDKGLSAMKIYIQWVEVVSFAAANLPNSKWLKSLEFELKNMHILRFTFMVRKDNKIAKRDLLSQIHNLGTNPVAKTFAILIALSPANIFMMLSRIRSFLVTYRKNR